MMLAPDAEPELRYPPALIWWCPDPECDWTHHARSARGWESPLARAWDKHRTIVHSTLAAELGFVVQELPL